MYINEIQDMLLVMQPTIAKSKVVKRFQRDIMGRRETRPAYSKCVSTELYGCKTFLDTGFTMQCTIAGVGGIQ